MVYALVVEQKYKTDSKLPGNLPDNQPAAKRWLRIRYGNRSSPAYLPVGRRVSLL